MRLKILAPVLGLVVSVPVTGADGIRLSGCEWGEELNLTGTTGEWEQIGDRVFMILGAGIDTTPDVTDDALHLLIYLRLSSHEDGRGSMTAGSGYLELYSMSNDWNRAELVEGRYKLSSTDRGLRIDAEYSGPLSRCRGDDSCKAAECTLSVILDGVMAEPYRNLITRFDGPLLRRFPQLAPWRIELGSGGGNSPP